MVKKFTILIADRNRHVREFLKREMIAEGYQVRLGSSSQEVLKWAFHHEPLDLLILDPDLLDAEDAALFEKLNDRIPTLPVVVHSFGSDYSSHPGLADAAAFVEKTGNSVERLKQVVSEVLRQSTFNSAGAPDEKKSH